MSLDTAQDTPVKNVVLGFFQEAFVNKDPEKAAREYMGTTYTQHNPLVGDGVESFVPAINGMLGQFPDFWIEAKRVITEGDLVAIHSHVKMTKDDPGNAVVDIFRVADGKIVEHWDIIQAIPPEPANNNTMF